MSCVKATNCEVIYRERLRADGQYSASRVIASGHLYLLSAKGVLTVVQTGDKFELPKLT